VGAFVRVSRSSGGQEKEIERGRDGAQEKESEMETKGGLCTSARVKLSENGVSSKRKVFIAPTKPADNQTSLSCSQQERRERLKMSSYRRRSGGGDERTQHAPPENIYRPLEECFNTPLLLRLPPPPCKKQT